MRGEPAAACSPSQRRGPIASPTCPHSSLMHVPTISAVPTALHHNAPTLHQAAPPDAPRTCTTPQQYCPAYIASKNSLLFDAGRAKIRSKAVLRFHDHRGTIPVTPSYRAGKQSFLKWNPYKNSFITWLAIFM